MSQRHSPEPQWLDCDEQQLWRLYLEVSQRLWARLGRELAAETGISLAEYDVLVKLSEAPEQTLRMSDLAARTTQSRSRLTHTVSRMEKVGHVVRAPCADDGRGVQASLTDAGAAALAAAAPSHVQSVRDHFIDHFDADTVPVVTHLLARLASHLRAGEPNAGAFNPTPHDAGGDPTE